MEPGKGIVSKVYTLVELFKSITKQQYRLKWLNFEHYWVGGRRVPNEFGHVLRR